MAIVNRDLDSSEQLYTVQHTANADVLVSVTLAAGIVKAPGQLLQVVVGGLGVSGTPHYTPQIHRWTSAGVTVIAPGGAVTLAAAFGLSGGLVGATFASSSSLAALQAGDVLVLATGGANSAVKQLFAEFVIKATQDIKKSHSIS